MSGAETDQRPVRLTPNPWNNPKLTIGEACDINIQEARRNVEELCIKKAKLEAMDWLKLPYHEVQSLMRIHNPY